MLAALFVGLIFGFVAYHIFVAPYIAKQAIRLAQENAAADIRAWLGSLDAEFRTTVEQTMSEFSARRSMAKLLKELMGPGNVAATDKKVEK